MAGDPKRRPATPGALDLLRPALELAWMAARLGSEANPALPPPRPLRPLLKFNRLPDRALATLRKTVDEDDDFRMRVSELADEKEIGRASWIWLTRPEGWEEELAHAEVEVESLKRERAASRDDQSHERRLAREVSLRIKAEQEALDAVVKADGLARELRAERQSVRDLRQELSGLSRIVEDAEQAAKRDRLAVESLEEAVSKLDRRRSQLEARLESLGPQAPGDSSLPVDSVLDAARQAQALSDSLSALAESLAAGSTPPVQPAASSTARVTAEPAAGAISRARRPGRRPTVGVGATRPGRLPPAVFDDSAEAAEHLVRVPGTLIVVDGYNVSFAGWPELAITDQRRRLADAMAELSARAGSDIHVVFDGGEPHDQELGVRSGPREPVRVTFSPPGVDADEVIIDMAKSLVRRRPVLVATSDRRVRERVEAGGASVISAVQLLGAAGRQVRRMSREA